MAEVDVYIAQTDWLLGQFLANLESATPRLLTAAPPAKLEGNNLLAIGRHAAGVTTAYVLGMGCGLDVSRDRSSEFVATAEDAASIISTLAGLRQRLPGVMAQLGPPRFDLEFVPDARLYGTGEPRLMTGREAIVENIRHLGIHLGELRLTRSLLEQA